MGRVSASLGALVFCSQVLASAADAPAPAPAASERILVLVRHGHHGTDPSADPAKGPPLTALGREQAALAAARLNASPHAFESVVASPMQRSLETANAIIAGRNGARLVTSSDLTECTPPMPSAQQSTLKDAAALKACADQFDRVYSAYVRPGDAAAKAQVLVAHTNVIRYLLTRALGMDTTAWQQFSISHASLTTLRIGPDGSVVVLGVGDIGHVPQGQRSGSIVDADSGTRRRR